MQEQRLRARASGSPLPVIYFDPGLFPDEAVGVQSPEDVFCFRLAGYTKDRQTDAAQV